MKTTLAIGTAAMLFAAAPATADIFTTSVNATWTSTGGANVGFALPELLSVKSITLDLAHTWGNDMDIIVTGPGGEVYDLMLNEIADNGSGNFDMGLVAGSGALANVDAYVFVAPGGGSPTWPGGFAPGGVYDANLWHAGSVAAGAWTLVVTDAVAGDGGSVGDLTIVYNVIPAPGALALLGVAGLVSRRRRRR